jgi:hypothetical protein
MYNKKLRSMEKIFNNRIEWLSKGSRKLFGTVIEKNVCFLIDKSESMSNSMSYLKNKLKQLLAVKCFITL